eukprot:4645852-Prymnesium_polylepis.1
MARSGTGDRGHGRVCDGAPEREGAVAAGGGRGGEEEAKGRPRGSGNDALPHAGQRRVRKRVDLGANGGARGVDDGVRHLRWRNRARRSRQEREGLARGGQQRVRKGRQAERAGGEAAVWRAEVREPPKKPERITNTKTPNRTTERGSNCRRDISGAFKRKLQPAPDFSGLVGLCRAAAAVADPS